MEKITIDTVKRAVIVLRIDDEMKNNFYKICKEKNINSAALLRNFISDFIAKNTKKEEN